MRLLALVAVLLSYAGPAAGAVNGPIAFASGNALYALDGSAEARGVNPDRIRRDDPRWARAAARHGGAG